MNLGKIFQKLKDLYGWEKSQLYLHKDKRAYHKALADSYKKKMDEATDVKTFNKARFMYEGHIEAFDRADFFVRNNEPDMGEDNWRSWK